MSKLKCWKKTGENFWRNERQFVEMYPYTGTIHKTYIVTNEKGFNAEGLIALERSKVRALQRAKEYMKDHDRC